MCQTSQILFVLSRTYIIDDHVCQKDMIIPSEQKKTYTQHKTRWTGERKIGD